MKKRLMLAIVAVAGLTLWAATPAEANHRMRGKWHGPGLHRAYHPAFHGRHRAPRARAFDPKHERRMARDFYRHERRMLRRGAVPVGPMYRAPVGIGFHDPYFSPGFGF